MLIPVIPVVWAIALLAAASPARADSLVGASPGSGARLQASPASVELTFDALVQPGSAAISVSGPGGPATTGSAMAFGTTVRQSLRADLADGTYTVSWHADFFLGDDRSGSYTFAVRRSVASTTPAAAPRPTTPKPTPRSTPAATRTAKPSTTQAAGSAITGAAQVLPRSAATSDPAVTVPATAVRAVSSTGSRRLPSPVVLWGLILVLAVVAVMINRWRQGRAAALAASTQNRHGRLQPDSGSLYRPALGLPDHPAPAVPDQAAPEVPDPPAPTTRPRGVTRAMALADPAGAERSRGVGLGDRSTIGASTTATVAAPISPALQNSHPQPATGPMRRSEARRAERSEAARADAPRPDEGRPEVRRSELRRSELRRSEPPPLSRADARRAERGRRSVTRDDDPSEQFEQFEQFPVLLPHDPI